MEYLNYCLCTHPDYEHSRIKDIGCAAYLIAGEYCRCKNYKRDNLKYLEQIYESHNCWYMPNL